MTRRKPRRSSDPRLGHDQEARFCKKARFCIVAGPGARSSLLLRCFENPERKRGRRRRGHRDGRRFEKREVSTWVRGDGVARARSVVRRLPGRRSAVADRGGRVPRGCERRGELTERVL